MQFICYTRCTTCQRAKKWLDEHGIQVEIRDIKTSNPTAEELRRWRERSGLPIKRLWNTSGLQYRTLNIKGRLNERMPNMGMTDQEQYDLMATDGMLVKRPIFIGDDFVLVGFNEAEWELRLPGMRS